MAPRPKSDAKVELRHTPACYTPTLTDGHPFQEGHHVAMETSMLKHFEARDTSSIKTAGSRANGVSIANSSASLPRQQIREYVTDSVFRDELKFWSSSNLQRDLS